MRVGRLSQFRYALIGALADDGLRPCGLILLLAELASVRAVASRQRVARSRAASIRLGGRDATVREACRPGRDVDRRSVVVGRPCQRALGRRPIRSKSFGTSISPARNPSRRGARGAPIAATFTRGFPAFAMMKVSPLAARSTSFESWVLAWWMLTVACGSVKVSFQPTHEKERLRWQPAGLRPCACT